MMRLRPFAWFAIAAAHPPETFDDTTSFGISADFARAGEALGDGFAEGVKPKIAERGNRRARAAKRSIERKKEAK